MVTPLQDWNFSKKSNSSRSSHKSRSYEPPSICWQSSLLQAHHTVQQEWLLLLLACLVPAVFALCCTVTDALQCRRLPVAVSKDPRWPRVVTGEPSGRVAAAFLCERVVWPSFPKLSLCTSGTADMARVLARVVRIARLVFGWQFLSGYFDCSCSLILAKLGWWAL